MTTEYIVRRGECTATIAARNGVHDPQVLVDHPDNAALYSDRPNPNVLAEGDVVRVPEPEREESLATSQVHIFRVTRPKKELRVVLHDAAGEPMADAAYTLRFGSEERVGVTDGDGAVKEEMPLGITGAELEIDERVLHLQLGFLDPMQAVADEGVRGIQARLRNLGYSVGPIDGIVGPRTKLGILVFRHDQGLEMTAEIDDALRDVLRDTHGS